MNYKIYTTKFKNYWRNYGQDYPEKHIEDIIINTWEQLENNNLQWQYPLESATLYADKTQDLDYLKVTDGGNNFYFYLENIDRVENFNAKFNYKLTYTLDKYMTYWYFFLEALREKNPTVWFNRKFTDRILYNTETETYKLNIIEQKQFGNTIDYGNLTYIRELLYNCNAIDILNANNLSYEPEQTIAFTNPISGDIINETYENLITVNKNNRYSYVICESSSIIDNSYLADNSYFIVPIIPTREKAFYEGINLIDSEIPSSFIFNPMSTGNFIASFECDIPPLFIARNFNVTNWWINNEKNGIVKDFLIFKIPLNKSIDINLIEFSQYNGLESKIKYIINNIQEKWNYETEPFLLNPAYYYETYKLDNDKEIKTDLSMINYEILSRNFDDTGLSLAAKLVFDTNFSIIYDYNTFNNTLNTFWNNNYSNLRNDMTLTVGAKTTNRANYAANNATTLYTGNQNLKEQTGFGIASGLLNLVSGVTGGIFGIKGAEKAAGKSASGFGIANTLLNTAGTGISIAQKNRNFNSMVQNINSSPNTTISQPFLLSYVPNKIENDKTLLWLYSNELHPLDKKRIFNDIANNGYIFNAPAKFNDYNNRQWMNVIDIDGNYNSSQIIEILNNTTTLFSSIKYITEFMVWLNQPIRLFNTPILVNVVEPNDNNYFNNIEINKTPLPTPQPKIDINTILTITNTLIPGKKDSTNIWGYNNCLENIIKNINGIDDITWNKLKPFLYPEIISDGVDGKISVTVLTNPTYEGIYDLTIPIVPNNKIYVTSTTDIWGVDGTIQEYSINSVNDIINVQVSPDNFGYVAWGYSDLIAKRIDYRTYADNVVLQSIDSIKALDVTVVVYNTTTYNNTIADFTTQSGSYEVFGGVIDKQLPPTTISYTQGSLVILTLYSYNNFVNTTGVTSNLHIFDDNLVDECKITTNKIDEINCYYSGDPEYKDFNIELDVGAAINTTLTAVNKAGEFNITLIFTNNNKNLFTYNNKNPDNIKLTLLNKNEI